jgi:hypothetical protein
MDGENTFLEGLSHENGYSLRGKKYQRTDRDSWQRLALGLMKGVLLHIREWLSATSESN